MPYKARQIKKAIAKRVDTRKSAYRRGYNKRWQRESKQFLKANPLCEICKRKGIIKAAECVDHIVPHKEDQELFWDKDNWQSACMRCNSVKGDRI